MPFSLYLRGWFVFILYMNFMRKLYSAVAAFSAAVIMWACGPAEMGYTEEYTLQGIYTVNKATVAPEFTDTFLFIRNIEDYELKTGDRAFLKLHYYYDAYSGKAPQWNIVDIIKEIPVYPLSRKSDIDTTMYKTPVTGLKSVNFFNSFNTSSWVWKDKQNINIKYMGVEKDASFAMAVRGVKDGCVELELYVNAPASDDETETLLTFDISNVADFLSDEDKALLTDSISTRIYLKRMYDGVLGDYDIPGNDIKH